MPVWVARSPAANSPLTYSGQCNLFGSFAPPFLDKGAITGNPFFSTISGRPRAKHRTSIQVYRATLLVETQVAERNIRSPRGFRRRYLGSWTRWYAGHL